MNSLIRTAAGNDTISVVPADTVRVVCYAGKSSKYDVPLQEQMDAMTEFCSRQPGWTTIGVFGEAHEGKRLSQRRDIRNIQDRMRAREVDVVLTTSLRHLSRNPAELSRFLADAEHFRAQVWTLEGRVDPFVRASLQLVVGLELGGNRQAMNARKNREMITDGRHVGRAPYGYRTVTAAGQPGRLEVVQEEAHIVRHVYERYLSGTSISNILRELKEMGVRPPRGCVWKASMLSEKGVAGILHDRVYTGLVVCGMYLTYTDGLTGMRHRILKPRKDWIIGAGRHTPLVSRDKFELVQKRYHQSSTAEAGN
ncbi:recombinase family protein [Bradyrhizobium sp. RDT46]|uniref:recombinase family protein n=1 Tax=Bradyrhizobium sp. RDT46 TaxID=3341829 RepID=UPI0035C6A9AD